MADIDIETIQWLNSLKLGQTIQYVSDLQNGYYLGVIFQRLNLSKGRKFKNSHDMACKFQNYKNVRDLLYENFKVQFPIQNILYNTGQLLLAIRDAIKKYNKDKKEATIRKIQSASESKIQPNEERMFASRQKDILSTSKFSQTAKLPKKIQEIEQKLEKYKEMKTKHELLALEDRKKQIEGNRRAIDEHRMFQLNKIRANHEFMKEHQRKVYDVWLKTQQIKKQRIQKDNTLKSFLQEKSNKFYQSLKMEEVKSFNQGQQAFQLNCIRQGIQLQHDPDRPKTKPEEHFNKTVFMQRVKDNIKVHEIQRKDRIKRQNKKRVDVKQANLKSEQLWNENNLVQSYSKKFNIHLQFCKKIEKVQNNHQAQRKIIQQSSKKKTFTELPSSNVDQQARKGEYNAKKRQYLDQTIVRLERRQKKHKIIAENLLDALVHLVIYNEDSYYKNIGFSHSQWKTIQSNFMKYQKNQQKFKDQSRFIDSNYDKFTKQYISNTGNWSHNDKNESQHYKLSNVLQKLIDTAFPPKQAPQKSDVPLYMPLKICFLGNKLSGKTTIIQKLSSKYGVLVINPVTILAQAFQLNKEPIVQDPKKKKDSKKPEEENPEKIALKQWGQKIMSKIQSPQLATVQHYLEAIEFKLRYNYQNKKGQDLLKQFQAAKVEETQRYNKALKQFQEFQKKGKKDKKGGAEISDQPPSQRKYFYTKGFILDGISLSLETLKLIQVKLNGYLSFEQKINPKAQQTKETVSNIIWVAKAKKDCRLKQSTFDLAIQLDVQKQTIQKRQASEKIQIPKINYQPINLFYQNFGIQKFKFKAYHKITNQQTVQQCLSSASKIIQQYLDLRYEEIKNVNSETQGPLETVGSQISDSQIIKLSKEQSQRLVNNFNNIYKRYFTKITQSLSDFDKLRQQFGDSLRQIQHNFISIINRPDDKAGKILNFQENYNRLLSQKTNIVKDAEASKHLISKLDELNDNLWVSLQGKKNEAVAQRKKVLKSPFLQNQIQKVVQVSKNLLENQLTLLVQIIFFIYNLHNTMQGKKDEIATQFLVLGIPPQLQPIFSFQPSNYACDRLEYYCSQTKKCIDQLPNWLKKKQKKIKILKSQYIENILKDFIQKRVSRLNEKIQQIALKTKEIYLEYFCFYTALTNKMDDWIIQGIKHENEFVYQIYKNIKKNINQAKKSSIKDLFVKEISQILRPISALPLHRLPITLETQTNKFKILSFTIFMQQVKCLSVGGKIPFKVFEAYINKRKKSSLLQPQFLRLELDIMQQYLVTDDYCNYREISLAMLLWKMKILEEDSINQYEKLLQGKLQNPVQDNINQHEKLLQGKSQNSAQSNFAYFKQELSLEEFKLIPGLATDKTQQKILKTLIFEIFRQQFKDKIIIQDYIEVLRQFSHLQVYRYGDTVMILNESGNQRYQGSS